MPNGVILSVSLRSMSLSCFSFSFAAFYPPRWRTWRASSRAPRAPMVPRYARPRRRFADFRALHRSLHSALARSAARSFADSCVWRSFFER
jgi:hypothetical protein